VKICIFGAGAVGGFIGGRLARAGVPVAAIARGEAARALRVHGFRLREGDVESSAPVRVASDPDELGPQDVVVVAVKGPSLASVAARIGPLLGRETVVVTAMNGVPWWFFEGFGGALCGTRLRSIDPDGRIAAAIPAHHVVGCVVHASCATPEPGVVRHVIGDELIVGEPGGASTPRVERLAALLVTAGFRTSVSTSIQTAIWYKLWGNMTTNPVSALTGATTDRILEDPLVNRFCLMVMREAAAIGAAIGCPVAQSGEDRNAITRKLGAFKTSMLQDVEAKRPVEIDALLAAPREIGERVGIATPSIDALLGLSRLHARGLGLYP
jgi:2-dehydropantoate 2-reductase